MPVKRINTLKLGFGAVTTRPSTLRIHEYIQDLFHWTVDQVLSIEIDVYRKCVYIKLVSELLCEKALREHGPVLQFTDEHGTHDLSFDLADQTVIPVRVHVVPSELSDDDIVSALSKYGECKRIRDELYDPAHIYHVRSGRKIVLMVLQKPIPSFVSICNQRFLVTYFGQERTCYFCDKGSHLQSACPNRVTKPQYTDIVSAVHRPQVMDTTSDPVNSARVLKPVNIPSSKHDTDFPRLQSTPSRLSLVHMHPRQLSNLPVCEPDTIASPVVDSACVSTTVIGALAPPALPLCEQVPEPQLYTDALVGSDNIGQRSVADPAHRTDCLDSLPIDVRDNNNATVINLHTVTLAAPEHAEGGYTHEMAIVPDKKRKKTTNAVSTKSAKTVDSVLAESRTPVTRASSRNKSSQDIDPPSSSTVHGNACQDP